MPWVINTEMQVREEEFRGKTLFLASDIPYVNDTPLRNKDWVRTPAFQMKWKS